MEPEHSNSLVALYARHIGPPSTTDEAYGYWLFVLGLAVAFAGIAAVLPTGTGDTLRGIGIAMASVGLVLLLVGPIVRLPLRRSATFVSYVGSLVAVLAVVWFAREFSAGNWSASFGNAEPFVIGLYGAGLLVIAAGGVAVPMLTDPRDAGDERPAAAGVSDRPDAGGASDPAEASRSELLDAELRRIRDSQSQFEIYTDRADEIRWRLRHRNRNIIADSGEGYTSRRAAQQGVAAVRRDAFGAALVDLDRTDAGVATDDVADADAAAFLTTAESAATFETYETDDGFRWRLRHDDGGVIADSVQGYSTERRRDSAIEYVRRYAGTADYLRVGPAAFEIGRDEAGRFRWRLLDGDGDVLADSAVGYATRGDAREGIASVRDGLADDTAAFDIHETDDGFRWRLLDGDGDAVAAASESHPSRGDARRATERVRERAPEATVLDVGAAVFEIYEGAGEGYRWRLRHRSGRVMAASGETYATRDRAEAAVGRVKRNAPGAPDRGVPS